jgi:hypothetical protein
MGRHFLPVFPPEICQKRNGLDWWEIRIVSIRTGLQPLY